MFEFGNFSNANCLPRRNACDESIHSRRYNTAVGQFKWLLTRGKVRRFWQQLAHHRVRLYELSELAPKLSGQGGSYAGIQVVDIKRIIGSEGRTADFDAEFHPISERSMERWVNMALAHLSHAPLPAVQLIQVGGAYFVRDGHHRISVARAFGQVAIDAEVIVWNAAGPWPWQLQAAPEERSWMPGELGAAGYDS